MKTFEELIDANKKLNESDDTAWLSLKIARNDIVKFKSGGTAVVTDVKTQKGASARNDIAVAPIPGVKFRQDGKSAWIPASDVEHVISMKDLLAKAGLI